MSGINIYPKFDATKSKHYRAVVGSGRFDDAGNIFVSKQLTFAETIVQNRIEADLTYNQAFPVVQKGGEGYKTIEYRTGFGDGKAEQIGDNGKFNRVQYSEEPEQIPVKNYGLEYGISYDEMKAAIVGNQNIETKKIIQTNRGMEEGADNCFWRGDKALPGLISTRYKADLNYYTTLTADGALRGGSSSKKWRNKTFEQMENDIIGMKLQVNAVYDGKFPVDTLLLEPEDYEVVMTTKNTYGLMFSDYLNKIGIKNIISCNELKNLYSAESKSAMVLLPKNPDVLQAVVTVPKKALPVFFDGWEYVTKYILSISGLHIFHPKKILVAKY